MTFNGLIDQMDKVSFESDEVFASDLGGKEAPKL